MNDGIDLVRLADRVAGWVHDLVPAPEALIGLLVIALLVLGNLLALREVATRYALAPHRRVRYRVRSTTASARSMEEMERWAAQLSRIRRRVRRFADRPAQAVRMRLESAPRGPVYTIEASRLAEPILCDPLLSDVQATRLRPRHRDDRPWRSPPAGSLALTRRGRPANGARTLVSRPHVVRAELLLARRDSEPLREVSLAPNPLAPFQQVLARVDAARGEHAEVVVDLLPATPRERLRFRRRQRQAEITGYVDGVTGSFAGDLDVLRGDPPGSSLPLAVLRNQAAVLFGSADAEQVTRKVAVPAALFYAQVLMRTTSFSRHRARAHLDALIACWEQWAGRNWFELAGTNVLGLVFIGSNTVLRRRWFDHRLSSGRFGPSRRRLLGARDLAGWIAPPATTVASPSPTVPAPPPMPRPSPSRDTATPMETLELPDRRARTDDHAVDNVVSIDAARRRKDDSA